MHILFLSLHAEDVSPLMQLLFNLADGLIFLSGYWFLQIAQACKPIVVRIGFWESVKSLARGYEFTMGLLLFTPIAVLSWFPFVSEFQTRLLFNQAFSRGLQISRILAGRKKL